MNNIENSMCYDRNTEKFNIQQEPLISIRCMTKEERYKSSMTIGNLTINNIKKFNYLQKKMCKWLLGIEIKGLKVSNE